MIDLVASVLLVGLIVIIVALAYYVAYLLEENRQLTNKYTHLQFQVSRLETDHEKIVKGLRLVKVPATSEYYRVGGPNDL